MGQNLVLILFLNTSTPWCCKWGQVFGKSAPFLVHWKCPLFPSSGSALCKRGNEKKWAARASSDWSPLDLCHECCGMEQERGAGCRAGTQTSKGACMGEEEKKAVNSQNTFFGCQVFTCLNPGDLDFWRLMLSIPSVVYSLTSVKWMQNWGSSDHWVPWVPKCQGKPRWSQCEHLFLVLSQGARSLRGFLHCGRAKGLLGLSLLKPD